MPSAEPPGCAACHRSAVTLPVPQATSSAGRRVRWRCLRTARAASAAPGNRDGQVHAVVDAGDAVEHLLDALGGAAVTLLIGRPTPPLAREVDDGFRDHGGCRMGAMWSAPSRPVAVAPRMRPRAPPRCRDRPASLSAPYAMTTGLSMAPSPSASMPYRAASAMARLARLAHAMSRAGLGKRLERALAGHSSHEHLAAAARSPVACGFHGLSRHFRHGGLDSVRCHRRVRRLVCPHAAHEPGIAGRQLEGHAATVAMADHDGRADAELGQQHVEVVDVDGHVDGHRPGAHGTLSRRDARTTATSVHADDIETFGQRGGQRTQLSRGRQRRVEQQQGGPEPVRR